MIVGTSYQSVNIRNQPKVVVGNEVGLLKDGDKFTGSELVSETSTRKWINLSTVNGVPFIGYVASWVVNYDEIPNSPVPVDDPIVSGTLTLASGKIVKMVVVND